MSAITYTASRNIEKNGFSASGTDISADTADDSFNATSTDLSGCADDEWVYVTGFTETANNGWFQVNGTPTASKIIQDSFSLTTEAAGDDVVITGYKRGSGTSYSFDLKTRTRSRTVQTDNDQSISLSGVAETLHHSRWEVWQVSTPPIARAYLGQLREFIESVMGGESFTFDPFGTVAIPDNPLSCTLESTSYSETEIDFTDYFNVSFQVRYVPA